MEIKVFMYDKPSRTVHPTNVHTIHIYIFFPNIHTLKCSAVFCDLGPDNC